MKKKKIFPYRRTWVVSPITKIKKSKKLYKRAKIKKEVDTLIKEDV
jgi:hypothetical protein